MTKRFRQLAGCLLFITALSVILNSQSRVEMRSETNLLTMAAQAEVETGDYPAALKKIERAFKINPNLGQGYILLGDIFLKEGQLDQAERHYRQAGSMLPGNPLPRLRLSQLFMAKGDEARAKKAAQAALKVDPLSGEAHSRLAQICFNRREFAREIREYRKALELNPNSSSDRNNLAAAYARQGDLASAVFQWRRALKVAPGSKEISANLRNALKQKKSRQDDQDK